jgi:hypothetical protein
MDEKNLRAQARAAKTTDERLLELLAIEPALSKIIACRPQLSDAVYEYLLQLNLIATLRLIATHGNTPAHFMLRLAQHRNLNVVKALAANPNLSADALQHLSAHKKPTVREVLAARRNLPPPVRAALLADKEASVRTAMIANPDICEAELDALLDDESPEVRARLACLRTPKRYARQLLADDHPAVLTNAIRFADSDDVRPHFARFMKNTDERVRLACITRMDDPELLDTAARQESNIVMLRWIARNPFTPESALKLFVDSGDEHVQEALAGNPFASSATLHALAQKIRISRDHQKVADALIDNMATTPETLMLIMEKGYTVYNDANLWGSTPNWPAEFVVSLALRYYRYSGADEPREVLADQLHFDSIATTQPAVDVLRFMATSHLHYHTDAAIGNRNTPSDAIAQFYAKSDTEKSKYTLEDMARNPATPIAILRELIPTHDRYLLNNPFLPDSILDAIPADSRSAGYFTADVLRRARKSHGISVNDLGLVTMKG